MLLAILALILAPAPPAPATPAAPAAAELTKLREDFLAGASRNDAAMHDRFWAKDLIYTGSAGRRVGKADILKDVCSAPAPKPGDPNTTFSAADVRIQQYGSAAVVAYQIGTGKLRFSKTETSDVAVAITGETAIVRGVSTRERPAIPEPGGSSDGAPFSAFYTMTLIQKDGVWKAVALHTSGP